MSCLCDSLREFFELRMACRGSADFGQLDDDVRVLFVAFSNTDTDHLQALEWFVREDCLELFPDPVAHLADQAGTVDAEDLYMKGRQDLLLSSRVGADNLVNHIVGCHEAGQVTRFRRACRRIELRSHALHRCIETRL